MDIKTRLSMSYYKKIAILNEEHNIDIVQNQKNNKIYVKKKTNCYNLEVYNSLHNLNLFGIPKIHELIEEDHSLTIIEEYVSGNTLSELILKNKITELDILNYMIQLCTILEKLHNLSVPIIHRDIKPSNIIITSSNILYLIDFNASKFFNCEKSCDTILLGTKGYAAPEQYGFGLSSQQTDIYAMGILLQELLPCCKELSCINKLKKIIDKCTKLDPKDRFINASSLKNSFSSLYNNVYKSDKFKNYIHNTSNDSVKFTTKSWHNFLPPGFRNFHILNMLIAIPYYFISFLLLFTFYDSNVNHIQLLIERIFLFLFIINIIFLSNNYANIQKFNIFYNSSNKILQSLGTLIMIFITSVFLILLMLMLLLATRNI